MARARNIKPGICKNEDLATCTIQARYLSAVLPCWADREGRLEDRPLRLKIEIFPADDGINVDDLLTELECAGYIIRYEKENTKYIQIVKFSKHQSPHVNEKASTIPAPDEHGTNTRAKPPDSHDSHDSKEKTRADTRAFQILKTRYGDKKGGSLAAKLMKSHTGPNALALIEKSERKDDGFAWLQACCKLRLPDDPILLWQVQKAVGLPKDFPDLDAQQSGIMAHIAGDKALTAKAQAVLR